MAESGYDHASKRARVEDKTGAVEPNSNPEPMSVQMHTITPLAAAGPLAADSAELSKDTFNRLQPGEPEFNGIVTHMNCVQGFFAVAIYAVSNPNLQSDFLRKSKEIARDNENNPNIIQGIHCTSKNAAYSIGKDGFKIEFSGMGFFGKGAYFAGIKDFLKANDYSPEKGQPRALRVMIICDVALGKNKNYEFGSFDKKLVHAPEGYHSVGGFISRATEYVVYDPTQVLPKYLVFYNFTNTALEMEKPRNLPAGISSQSVVYITYHLSEFFSALKKMVPPERQQDIRDLISRLLKKKIDVSDFVTQTSIIVGTNPPAKLQGLIEAELEKCKLSAKVSVASPAPPAPPPTLTTSGISPSLALLASVASSALATIQPPTQIGDASSKPSVPVSSIITRRGPPLLGTTPSGSTTQPPQEVRLSPINPTPTLVPSVPTILTHSQSFSSATSPAPQREGDKKRKQ